MREKEVLRRRFSSEPEKYYQVALFAEKGFVRKQCPSCGKFFWTLDENRKTCPEPPCQYYEFLGNPPTQRPFDYVESWRQIESFFVQNGHTSVKRYPVVCRWRPDLFFTVASIIDFQRVEGGKVVFELPANPLIVPQMCLRFNDIPNVGVSGKHYTGFCMVGQHSIADSDGYWKDRCIDLDFRLLTGPFGIDPREVVFVEDVWLGYGAFGYSLEYHVRGIELGNAVFTAFEGTPENYREMVEQVIDMGAGLERFAWLTQGTPTSYDSAFGPVVTRLFDRCGVDYDSEFFLRYAKLAGALNLDEVSDLALAKRQVAKELNVPMEMLVRKIAPLEAVYAIADHARSLLFAIADGLLPSNVGGGYNLRVILRRARGFIARHGWNLSLDEVAAWHIEYLRGLYPELEEHRDDVATILQVEEHRYRAASERGSRIVESLRKAQRPPTEEELIKLYDSEGVTPEMLRDGGLEVEAPADFYVKVTARHTGEKLEPQRPRYDVDRLSATKLLYYENQDLWEFSARVLAVFDDGSVALDQTAFYPRGGGQEPDRGFIDKFPVVDVEKYGEVVLHRLKELRLRVGDVVHCVVDRERRLTIMRIHTATHVINGASREVLGPWVWQHSAFKDVAQGRLDITHYAHLTREEIQRIEDLANEVVRQDLPVQREWLPRMEAERRYGFRLYQGGAIPAKQLRVIKIGDFDVEACGGIHCFSTGQIGFIKLVKAERVQDGVERIAFLAGEPAVKLAQRHDAMLNSISETLGSPRERVVQAVADLRAEFDSLRRRQRLMAKRLAQALLDEIPSKAMRVGDVKVYVSFEEGLDEETQIKVGESAIAAEPRLVHCAFISNDAKVRVLVFCGREAQAAGVRAKDLVTQVATLLGGSGGGDLRFAQGGGNEVEKVARVKERVPEIVRGLIAGKRTS